MRRTIPFLLLCSVIIFSCNKGAHQKFEFIYYPARNIYYDVTNAEFVYSVNGGKTWETFKKDLDKDPATLGSREVIYSNSMQPWDSNETHIKLYNGHLFSVADEDTTALSSKISDKKTIKKAKPVTESTKKEKKPGFFKRLFGKKN